MRPEQMSPAQPPIEERREPQLDAQSLTAPEPEADRPLGPDAVVPPEPEACGVGAGDPWAADLPPAGLDAGTRWTRNRRRLSLLAVGLVVGVLVLAALASLFRSTEPQIAPAPTPTEALRKALSAGVKSMQAGLAQEKQAREALSAEVAALRVQLEQIQQAPSSAAKRKERLTAIESRLEALSDLELFAGVAGARLEELETQITFIDEALRGKRQAGSAHGQSAPPTPQVELPFHLAAIEVWDGRIFASLLHDGRQVLVQPGDQCAGWTVQSIDGARRTVRFVRNGVTAVRRAPK